MKILQPATEEQLKMYYDLRYQILRKPWNQPYDSTFDEWEKNSVHALMVDEKGNAIAAGRLQINSADEGQVRSMAVKESEQGRGHGKKMLQWLETEAARRNMKHIVLDARDGAVEFYSKNGYVIEGDSYTLFGSIVHFRMKKILNFEL